MLGLFVEPPGNSDRFCDREVAAKVVFAWPVHLAGRDEIGLLEIFQRNSNDWIVQHLRVCSFQSFCQLWHVLALDKHRANRLKRDKTIRLNRYGLIEIRSHRKIQLEAIPFAQAVTRVPFLKTWNGGSWRSGGHQGATHGWGACSDFLCYRRNPC